MVRYAVVEFEGSELEVIPENWLQNNNQICLWPNQRAASTITTAINRAKSPETDWQSWNVVRVFGFYDSALEARDKAKKFAVNSDLGTDSGKRKRKPKVSQELTTYALKGKKKRSIATVNHETSDSSIDEFDDPPPAPPVRFSASIKRETMRNDPLISSPNCTPSTSQVVTNSSLQQGSYDGNEVHVSRNVTSPQTVADNCCCSKGFQAELISSISYLKIKLQEILIAQGAIQQQLNSSKRIAFEAHAINLPLKTINELEELEEKIKVDHSMYSELASKLDGLGGRSVRLCTFSTMRKLLTNDVAACLNWKGRNNKVPFEGYTICDIVANCISYQFGKKDGNIADIKSAIQDWLKAAKQRMNKPPVESGREAGAEED